MANYGNKDSTQRGKWWSEFVSPLGLLAANTSGVPRLGMKRADWMARKRPIPSSWIKGKLLKTAKAIGSAVGVKVREGDLNNLAKAKKKLAALQAGPAPAAAPTAPAPAAEPAAEYEMPEVPPVDLFAAPAGTSNFADPFGAPPSGIGGSLAPPGQEQPLAMVDGGYGEEPAAGMPGWLKLTLGITGGLVVLGGGTLAIIKLSR